MEKMREEFEKWFYDNAGLKCKFDSYDNAYVTASSKTTGDTIVNTSCCIAWQSWKASRAALCVELPEQECGGDGHYYEDGLARGHNECLELAASILDDEGVK